MSDTISKSALLETIDERVEGLPKSRVDLGGYHTGQKNAFLGLIDTIQSGRFDTEGWISVKDRLPELSEDKDSITCNVFTTSGTVMSMDWRRNMYAKTERGRAPRWKWNNQLSPWEVTHWMPLPKPPKGEDNE